MFFLFRDMWVSVVVDRIQVTVDSTTCLVSGFLLLVQLLQTVPENARFQVVWRGLSVYVARSLRLRGAPRHDVFSFQSSFFETHH